MNFVPVFHPYGAAHLVVIFLTVFLPVLLAGLVRWSGSSRVERVIAVSLCALLILDYAIFVVHIAHSRAIEWQGLLPLQLCDWGMAVMIVALLTGRSHWFEVAYFWGLGGTLQAVLTPNLPFGFPDIRFVSFFISHGGIIVGVLFMMLVRGARPQPMSIVRVFAWTEFYFAVTLAADFLTGHNYGFLLHKPEAFSLLSYLSSWRPLYLLQMQGVALLFFAVLYAPFAIYDLVTGIASHESHKGHKGKI